MLGCSLLLLPVGDLAGDPSFAWSVYVITINDAFQTTIMAVEFDGGVVLGADSRTSTGNGCD